MASLLAYGKVNEADQERIQNRRKTRKRIAIITLSSVILVGVIVAAVVGTSHGKDKASGGNGKPLSASIKAMCDATLYPESCRTSLTPLVNSKRAIHPEDIYKLSVQVAAEELSSASRRLKKVSDPQMTAALESCVELLDLALDHLGSAVSNIEGSLYDASDDLKMWLSAAGTYQQTCIDGFDYATGGIKNDVYKYLKNSTEFTSNSLAIVSELERLASSFKLRRRRLLGIDSHHNDVEMEPKWLVSKDRKLLQTGSSKIKADVVVAKDGSGKYRTIGDALKAVPEKSKKRFVIYVKKGVYSENVRIEKSKWNVMMIGDGMAATVVTGGKNFVDGTPTFQSATFAVFGKGFIARDMGFRNTAGAAKHQAVALMSTADQSVFYRCRMDAFQDTLYAHSNRQFYRECNIYGTVDFIFGNSAVVLQNCNILPRKPLLGQQNTITAQGRFDPNQNTGISIQNCTIWPFGNLTNVHTFLGRPWKNYSTTVYMNNVIGSLIDPKGWLPWVGDTAPNTIFYAEFKNFGPGSSTKNRVKWKGLRNITSKQVGKFTVQSFIKGEKWIPDTGVRYELGL